MKKEIIKKAGVLPASGTELAELIWAESWTYIKTIVDTVHEPFLILNKKLCVMAANEAFYRMFQVEEKDTENKLVYKLGNGQWNIPSLKKLLEEILPKQTFFKGFENFFFVFFLLVCLILIILFILERTFFKGFEAFLAGFLTAVFFLAGALCLCCVFFLSFTACNPPKELQIF